MDLVHTLVQDRFCLHLVHGHTSNKITLTAQLILPDNRRPQFQSELPMGLSSKQNARDPSEHCKQIKEALYSAVTLTQDTLPYKPQKR